jgi:queuine tRNA-ribosyltransferase
MNPFIVTHRDAQTKARAGILKTAHGDIETPVFMPVGTQASVKLVGADEVAAMGYRIILSNTYHLFLRPGETTLKDAGGVHAFMSWPNALLTDSGGYQVFSLATRCKLSEEGVEFTSHVDGERRRLSPETTTAFQMGIGSDIAMCLDDCPPYPSLKSDAETSMELTLRWAQRCKAVYENTLASTQSGQLLFGITQGAGFSDLRRQCAVRMVELGFPGYAIGGLGLGEPRALTWDMVEASVDPLPDQAPHYLMGFGQPEDMWDGVERGVDMFDCVLPTRNARNGQALTSSGRLNVSNARFRNDFTPLDPGCQCPCCRGYTRAYLCHLFRAAEMLGPRLVTLHNLWFMLGLMRFIRQSILECRFQTAKNEFFRKFQTDKLVPHA